MTLQAESRQWNVRLSRDRGRVLPVRIWSAVAFLTLSIMGCGASEDTARREPSGSPDSQWRTGEAIDSLPHTRPAVDEAGGFSPGGGEGVIPRRVLDAARFVRDRRGFRKTLILETGIPEPYPRVLQRNLDLTSAELAAICWLALRLERMDLDKDFAGLPIGGYSVNPSQDFWDAVRESGRYEDELNWSQEALLDSLGIKDSAETE